MATYNTLPATLAALFATKDDPQGTEPVSVLDDALRQTRNWLYDFMSIYIDSSTGKIKSTAFTDGSLPSGVVRGTNPVGNTQREIAQGSILNADLADATILGAKIGLGAIVNANIADNTIQGGKLADGSVTSAKIAASVLTTGNIADGSITAAKIAVGTITADRIAGNAITKDQMGANSVIGAALPLSLEGQVLVGGNGSDGKQLAVKPMTGVIAIDKDGVTTFSGSIFGNALSYARIVEATGQGVNANSVGGSLNTWYRRGSGVLGLPVWSIQNPTRDFLELGANGQIHFKENGKYLVRASAPGRGSMARHKIMIGYFPNPSDVSTGRAYFGSSEDPDTGVQTRSHVEALLEVVVNNATVGGRPYFFLAHAGESNFSAGDLGLGGSITAIPSPFTVLPINEIYADISVLKVQEDSEID